MKILSLGLGFALLAAASLRADIVLVQQVEGAGQSGEMTIKIKGDLLRADVSNQVSIITDTASGKFTTVMHPQKVYMEMNPGALAGLQQAFQKEAGAAGDHAEPVLKATGKKETINGYETELFTTETGGLKSSYWIAKNYPNQEKLLAVLKKMQDSPLSKMARKMAPQPSDFPGVPVKTEVEISPGEKTTSTLISAEEKALSDADFAVPEGYQPVAAPSFGGGAPE